MKRILAVLIIFALFSCNKQASKKEVKPNTKLLVITVNYPLYYFADRIGGEFINLEYLIPNDVDPAFWIPNENELGVYQSADIILTNGANYAKWIENVSLPSSRIINTSSSIEARLIPLVGGESHSHGPEGEHEHTGYAFTTWLDFKLALKQAESIRDILVKKIPGKELIFNDNFNTLKEDLEKLDAQMIKAASQLTEINVLGSHPVYQYLAKGYNLNIESVHFEPNEIPEKKQWEEFENLIIGSTPRLMLWEDSPISELEKQLLNLDVKILVFKPCSNMPTEGDFLSIMNNNINNLISVF